MSTWLDTDHASALVKKATDMLHIKNSRATSMGTLLGVILHGLTAMFESTLQRQQIADFSRVGILFWIAFGIFVFNLSVLFRRPRLDQKIEDALALIDKAKKEGHASRMQVNLMYKTLVEKVIAQVTLDKPTEERIRQIENLSGGSDRPSP